MSMKKLIVAVLDDDYDSSKLALRFGGVSIGTPRTLRHPMRRWRVEIPFRDNTQYEEVRSYVRLHYSGTVALEED
jgi:hypothetical protein